MADVQDEDRPMDHADRIMFLAKDPTVQLDGHDLPAMTTLLYRVCNNDVKRFEEASRLVRLFILKALEVGPEKTATD